MVSSLQEIEGNIEKDGKRICCQSLGWMKDLCQDWTDNHQVGSKGELNCVGQNFSSVVEHDWLSASKVCHYNTNVKIVLLRHLQPFHFHLLFRPPIQSMFVSLCCTS